MKAKGEPAGRVLEALRARGLIVKASPSSFQCQCPAHDDRRASLSVSTGDGNRVLIYCFAGCETRAVVAALGLRMKDLFPKGRKRGRK